MAVVQRLELRSLAGASVLSAESELRGKTGAALRKR